MNGKKRSGRPVDRSNNPAIRRLQIWLFVETIRGLAVSCMAAPVQRRAMDGERQYFTFRQTRRSEPMTFSMIFVQASVPLSMGSDGIGACTMVSHTRQESLGRTWRIGSPACRDRARAGRWRRRRRPNRAWAGTSGPATPSDGGLLPTLIHDMFPVHMSRIEPHARTENG